ncbi:MAG: DUF1229 domain-containing protein [Leptospira sp.]|nr:DUF1229 domain-containing protein [Leptospira sp.]
MYLFLIKKRIITEYLCYFFLFLCGMGNTNVEIALLSILGMYFFVVKQFYRFYTNIKLGIGFSFFLIFIIFYARYYISPEPPPGWENMDLDYWNYILKSMQLLLVYLIVGIEPKPKNKFKLLASLSLGMLFVAILNSVFTMIYLDPPYYGKSYHIFHKVIVNSPGTTILGGMASILFLSFLTNKDYKPFAFGIGSILVLSLGIFISILYSARTLFFEILIIFSLQISFLIMRRFSLKKIEGLRYLFLIFTSLLVAFFLIDHPLFSRIKDRIVSGDYLVKFQHTIDYWTQIKTGFWIYPKDHSGYVWFHNFFFDVHRTSGPKTAIVNYSFFIIILFLLLKNIQKRTYFHKELLVLFIAFFPFLYTTIPWESSENQMISFYAGLVAMVLTDERSSKFNSKKNTDN